MPVKAYNNIGKVERYYVLLRRAYKIIHNKFQNNTSIKLALQITIKAVKDSVSPGGIIPTVTAHAKDQEKRSAEWE
jgi:hypothetical protein